MSLLSRNLACVPLLAVDLPTAPNAANARHAGLLSTHLEAPEPARWLADPNKGLGPGLVSTALPGSCFLTFQLVYLIPSFGHEVFRLDFSYHHSPIVLPTA